MVLRLSLVYLVVTFLWFAIILLYLCVSGIGSHIFCIPVCIFLVSTVAYMGLYCLSPG